MIPTSCSIALQPIMNDLYLSLLLMLLLSLAAFIQGVRLQRGQYRRWAPLVIYGACGLMLIYLAVVWDRPLIVWLLPFSSAVVLGNCLPVFGSLYAGICLGAAAIPWYRRIFLSTPLLALGVFSLVRPLTGEAPVCVPTASGGTFQSQSTLYTCSAACAAGVLRMHGITASEAEMAELCLTRQGTHWLGVYRGLKLKTAGTNLDVVVRRVSGAELGSASTGSGVLSLTFHGSAAGRRNCETVFNSESGHSVICLGPAGEGRIDVFDPAPDFGFECWNRNHLQDVADGILLELVNREDGSRAEPVSLQIASLRPL